MTEEKFELTKFSTYKKFAEKIYKIKKNVKKNIQKLKLMEKKLLVMDHLQKRLQL